MIALGGEPARDLGRARVGACSSICATTSAPPEAPRGPADLLLSLSARTEHCLRRWGFPTSLVFDPRKQWQVARLPDSDTDSGRWRSSPERFSDPHRAEPRPGCLLAAENGTTAGVAGRLHRQGPVGGLGPATAGAGARDERRRDGAKLGIRLRRRRRSQDPRPSVAAAFSPDGDRVAASDGSQVHLCTARCPRAASGCRAGPTGPAVPDPAPARARTSASRGSDSTPTAGCSWQGGAARELRRRVWQAKSGERVAELGAGPTVDAIPVQGDKHVLIVKEVAVWEDRAVGSPRRAARAEDHHRPEIRAHGRRQPGRSAPRHFWDLGDDLEFGGREAPRPAR